MAANKDELVSIAHRHTIKKFELIESYVAEWAQKLLQNQYCEELVFIDCMCNSGVYKDENGDEVYGTPIRVARLLRDISGQFPTKKIVLFFNDLSSDKIDLLRSKIPADTDRFTIRTSVGDGNELLRMLSPWLPKAKGMHYLLLYDPYDASIDWDALQPFLNNWGEVIINHMVSDTIRAVGQAKKADAVGKYEKTYQASHDDLLLLGNDKKAYEQKLEQIIMSLRASHLRNYHIAAFPFFNSRNAMLYNLIHCTGHIEGFRLYKRVAWKTFGGKSSTKDTHGRQNQILLDFDCSGMLRTNSDENCYYVKDIAEYILNIFSGREDVLLADIWSALDAHSFFPSDGYRNEIKNELKQSYGAKIGRGTITFTGKK